jgi:hypothetical protein
MMFLMLILMVTAAVTLLTLGITRAAHRDWRRSLVCIATGAILVILFGHQARQYRAEVKIRANEYARIPQGSHVTNSIWMQSNGRCPYGGRCRWKAKCEHVSK